jgi:hypothetical protein
VQEALKHYLAAVSVPGASDEAVATAQDAAASLQERLRLLGMFRQATEFAASAPNESLSICQALLNEVRHRQPLVPRAATRVLGPLQQAYCAASLSNRLPVECFAGRCDAAGTAPLRLGSPGHCCAAHRNITRSHASYSCAHTASHSFWGATGIAQCAAQVLLC